MSPFDFNHCRVCGSLVPEADRAWARKQVQNAICSTECQKEEIKQRFACCSKAQFSPCVCTWSFECPEHGTTHIGTHD